MIIVIKNYMSGTVMCAAIELYINTTSALKLYINTTATIELYINTAAGIELYINSAPCFSGLSPLFAMPYPMRVRG